MDEEQRKALRKAVAEGVSTQLDGTIGEGLRKLGVDEAVVSQILANAGTEAALITCKKACEIEHGLNTPEYDKCILRCDD